MAHKVFICHSSKDKAVANAACAALESRRIPCWMAPRDILAGKEWGASIIHGLDQCQIILLIFSSNANNSAQCRREIERAVSKEKILVPFRIENVMPSDAMEYALMNTHWLDALNPPLEQRLNELCDTVARLLDQPVDPGQTALWTRPPQPASRRKWFLWAVPLCVLLLAVVAVAGLHLYRAKATTSVGPTPEGPATPAYNAQSPRDQPTIPQPKLPKTQPGNVVHTQPPQPPVEPKRDTPPPPPAISAEQQARLDALETRIDALQNASVGVNDSLANLKQQMAPNTLNSQWVELQAGMKTSLDKATDALRQKDADRAERYANTADADIKQLKSFLGR